MLAGVIASRLAICSQDPTDKQYFNELVSAVMDAVGISWHSIKSGLEFLDPLQGPHASGRFSRDEDSPIAMWTSRCAAATAAAEPQDRPFAVVLTSEDIRVAHSVHSTWLIQAVRTRDWRKNASMVSTTSEEMEDVLLPATLLGGAKQQRETAEWHIHTVSIGKSRLVDRAEVEDYLALQGVLRSYSTLSNPKEPRPLNLSVFGAPGSGKSFGVKELVKFCSRTGLGFSSKILEFNMSQFGSVVDLAEALHKVRDECMTGSIPVAFFDEFDSIYGGMPFGWFKYLLMPMQDACFWDKNMQYRLGRCVLIFAGGINRSFQELHGRLRDEDFVAGKGPDFMSRLRGFLNIRSINYQDGASEEEKQRTRMRRAVVLHGVMKRMHEDAGFDIPAGALLDKGAVWALLEIPGFRHGVRSLEAILAMSDFKPGLTLTASRLPSSAQIDMHVDERAWKKKLQEGRSQLVWLDALGGLG